MDSHEAPARRPTIHDVAARAAVSKSLVSLVLRGDSHVSDQRRSAVLNAVAELGYRPNRSARGLSERRSRTIGVLTNDMRNPWFVDLLEGLTASLDAAGLVPVIVDGRMYARVGRDAVEALLDRDIDGIVVVGTPTDPDAVLRAAATTPVVLAGTHDPALASVDVVTDDDVTGARLATEHLLQIGHRRIAHLEGPGVVGELRRRGFDEAMASAGASPVVDHGGDSDSGGYAAAMRVFDDDDRPTAIFAFNDISCVGAYSAAVDRGLTVPDDLSLVGFDDTYLARIRLLSLTSVDNGNLAVGHQAGRFMIDRLEDPQRPRQVSLVAPSLHVRASSAPHRPGKV